MLAAGISLPFSRRLPWRRAGDVAAWAALLWGFGLRIRCHGAPARGGAVLHVANHVSWTDIVVLGRLLDAGFVAKSEVGGWPVIGALTKAYGCLLVDRERRGEAGRQAGDLAAHLQGARGLILFAEGTTGPGDAVLPFRSSLFAMVAGAGGGQVQPVTIRYAHADGTPLLPAQRRAVAWMDDDALVPHALALADRGGLMVDVWFEAPLCARHFANRKALARACEAAIGGRLAGQAAPDLPGAAPI